MSRNALKEYCVISATRGLSIKTLTRQFDDVATAAEVEALQEMRGQKMAGMGAAEVMPSATVRLLRAEEPASGEPVLK